MTPHLIRVDRTPDGFVIWVSDIPAIIPRGDIAALASSVRMRVTRSEAVRIQGKWACSARARFALKERLKEALADVPCPRSEFGGAAWWAKVIEAACAKAEPSQAIPLRCTNPECPHIGSTEFAGKCGLCGNFICNAVEPAVPDATSRFASIEHPQAVEDVVGMHCPVCDARWQTELPQ